MNTITRHETGPRMSRAVAYQGTVYLAGVTADDRTQGVQGQTRQVLEKIDRMLALAGSGKSRILFAQIWLKDIEAGFSEMNAVWEEWVSAGCTPARATVEARLASNDVLLEIAITAAQENYSNPRSS